MIINFSIWKAEEKNNDKSPDYRIATSIDGNFVEIGAGWKKVSKDQKNYISCTLSKPFKDKSGYEIREIGREKSLDELSPHQEPSIELL